MTIGRLDPNDIEYRYYCNLIFDYNHTLQAAIKSILCTIVDPTIEVAVASVGSDARYEKGPVSPIEISVYSTTPGSFNIQTIVDQTEAYSIHRLFEEQIEQKIIDSGSIVKTELYGPDGPVIITSPNRVFDANYLCGNHEILLQAKRELIIQLSSPEGRSTYRQIKKRVHDHIGIALTGSQRYKGMHLRHYDLEEGIAYYNPDERLSSFKQGPLRLVQFAIVRDLIRDIRKGLPLSEIIQMHPNTNQKLTDLAAQGNVPLSSCTLSELTDCYEFFLHQYHLSQWSYRFCSDYISYFDKKEVGERCASVAKICKERLIQFN